MYVMSTKRVKVFLPSSILRQVKSGSEVFGLSLFSFYQIVTLLPTFTFHKPWLTESSGAEQTFTDLEECTFYLLSFLPLLEVEVIPALLKIIKVTSEMKLTSLRLLGKVWKKTILTFFTFS